jgi:prepilin-type N-terminal cleavage/methylation domain-containing protein
MKPALQPTVARGFSLIESLIALVLVAFGLLALVGVSTRLAQSEDVARQRGEAARLAQAKIEDLRSYTQIAAASGVVSWDSLAGGTDTVGSSEDYATNASFTRTWQLRGATSDPMRNLQVQVSWTDRAGEAQAVSYASLISRTDPTDVGSLGFPLPGNTTLKRPKNRSISVPVPALELGNGKSVVQLQANMAVVFSNESGYVVQTCNKTVTTAADLTTGCVTANAYILAGYISGTIPTGLSINTGQITGATGTSCSLGNAVDQNSGAVIAGYRYYLCVISMPSVGAAWSGTLRLGGLGLNVKAMDNQDYLVCRFQYPAANGVSTNSRNVQPYSGVGDSLDSQNYIIATGSTCPTVSSLVTTEHQNCRTSGGNSVGATQRGVNCPV